MSSVLSQIIRGLLISAGLLIVLIGLLMVGLNQDMESVYKNSSQSLGEIVKELGKGRFVIAHTDQSLSLCDVDIRHKDDLDNRKCLGENVISMHLAPPFVYVYYKHPMQDRINPDYFKVGLGEEAWMSFFLFGPNDEYKIRSYEKIPNYIKVNYDTGERWIYGKGEIHQLPKSDRMIFDQISNNHQILIDGNVYVNREYEGAEKANSIGTYFGSNNPKSRGNVPFLKNK